MSSDKPTSAHTNPRRRILWLVVVHVVAGLLAAVVANFAGSRPSLRGAALIGIVFSQASLLGIWIGLGSSPWWRRLLGVVFGIGYLRLLLVCFSSVDSGVFFIVVVATMCMTTLLMLIVRLFHVAIYLDSLPVASMGRIQFSIRQLMILTFVVACLITIGKWVQPYSPHGEILFLLLLLAVTFGAVGILPVWFILATKQPVLYSVGLVAVGAAAGYSFARIGSAGHERFWLIATATEAMAVVVSLLVVRSGGYRLLRLQPSCTGDRSAQSSAC